MVRTLQKNFDGPICMMRLEQERIVHSHTHNFLEFVYIANGTATYDINGKSGALKVGDYFVIDYHTSHSYFSEARDLTVINCLFLPEFIDKSFSDVKNFNDLIERYFLSMCGRKIKGPTANQVFCDDGSVGALFSQMYKEFSERDEGFLEMLRYNLCSILIQTVRKVGSTVVRSKITAQILKEVDSKYMNHISLEKLCKELHYSLPYISIKFKDEMGVTFTEYLQNKRIEESCRLLTTEDVTISEAAEKVGYTNIKFFNKIFRKVTKMSPREFRKTYKEKIFD